MREFTITFQQGLQVGLRNEATNPRNNQALVECRNVRVSKSGLEEYTDITQPFTLTANWPFTQVWQGEQDFLVFDETDVYRLDTSTWAKTTVISNATSGVSWHAADFIDYVVLTNGSEIYERNPDTGAYSKNPSSFPSFKTCCNCNGRLIVGNLSGWYDTDASFIAYSRVGDNSLEPDEKNESGYSSAWCGEIYKVKTLGNGFIAYGASGVRAFKISGKYFEQRQVADFGIASRDAVGGDENFHIFMDDLGELWEIDTNYQAKRLGYKEFLSSMIGSDVVISYNPNPGEFYITDNNKAFLLYKGLSEVYQLPGGLGFFSGSKISVLNTNASNFYLVTDVIDLENRGFKKIETLELGVDADVDLEAAVQYRSNKIRTWNTSPFKQINQLGNVYIGVEANEFRLVVKASSKGAVNLDYINITYKISDKRTIRGQR